MVFGNFEHALKIFKQNTGIQYKKKHLEHLLNSPQQPSSNKLLTGCMYASFCMPNVQHVFSKKKTTNNYTPNDLTQTY